MNLRAAGFLILFYVVLMAFAFAGAPRPQLAAQLSAGSTPDCPATVSHLEAVVGVLERENGLLEKQNVSLRAWSEHLSLELATCEWGRRSLEATIAAQGTPIVVTPTDPPMRVRARFPLVINRR